VIFLTHCLDTDTGSVRYKGKENTDTSSVRYKGKESTDTGSVTCKGKENKEQKHLPPVGCTFFRMHSGSFKDLVCSLVCGN
jgi:hypothetical protein